MMMKWPGAVMIPKVCVFRRILVIFAPFCPKTLDPIVGMRGSMVIGLQPCMTMSQAPCPCCPVFVDTFHASTAILCEFILYDDGHG